MTTIKDKLGYIPSKKTDGKYAILMETSGEESESWYYFIRYDGNEENLKDLQQQLEKIEWVIIEDLSTFDLELENLVSSQTAKEMSKVDLNHTSFHRKFDGILQKIDFKFKKKYDNEDKITKIFNILGYGQIENFIDDEDLDEEDLVSLSSDDDNEDNNDDTEDDSSSEEEEEEEETKKDLKQILKNKLIKNKL